MKVNLQNYSSYRTLQNSNKTNFYSEEKNINFRYLTLFIFLFSQIIGFAAAPNQNQLQKELNDPVIKNLYAPDGPYSKFKQENEMLEKRDETSKHFDNHDGTFTALLTAGPSHYLENGVWKTSSNAIITNVSSSKSALFANIHNKVKTYYGNSSDGIYFKKDGVKLATYKTSKVVLYSADKKAGKDILGFVNVQPTLSEKKNNHIDYAVAKNVVYSAEQQTGSVKSQYVIQNNIFNKYNVQEFAGFEEVLIFNENIQVKQNEKSVVFLNTKGEQVLRYSDLRYFSESKLHQYEEATYLVEKINTTTFKIVMLVPIAWLQKSTTSYPIIIDPTVTFTPTNSTDNTGAASINEDGVGCSNDYVTPTIRTGLNDRSYPTCDRVWQGFAKFNISLLTTQCPYSAQFLAYQTSWTDGGGGDRRMRFDVGWANTNPVPDSRTTIYNAINNMERYTSWDVWGNCGGSCTDYNETTNNAWKDFLISNNEASILRVINRNTNHMTMGMDLTDYGSKDLGGDDNRYIEFEGYSSGNRPQLIVSYVSVSNTAPTAPPTSQITPPADNRWYHYAYNGTNVSSSTVNTTGITYAGFYAGNTTLDFDTETGTYAWNTNYSPSHASGYTGTCVGLNNHTLRSVRRGFPCSVYSIRVPKHDDDAELYINGTRVWQHLGCCDNHNNVWTGYLSSTSNVEIRHAEGVGGSNQGLMFSNTITTLSGGTIGGITNNSEYCYQADPGAFTNSVSPSGGTVGITNGSPAAPTYDWQRSTSSDFSTGVTNLGVNTLTYDPSSGLANGTYYFRRKVTDACDTVAYSNVITIIIRPQLTPSASAAVAACADPTNPYAELTATAPGFGISGTWTKVSGNGTITTPSSNSTTITGLSGTTTVQWTLNYTDNAPACSTALAASISITPTTTFDASTVSLASTPSAPYYSCITCNVKNGKTYTYYDNLGKIIAKVVDPSGGVIEMGVSEICEGYDYKPTGTPSSSDVKTVTTNVGDQQPYLPRHWSINPNTKTGQSVDVTLYFTKAEFDALKAKAVGTDYAFNDETNLLVTKYDGGSAGAFTAPTPSPATAKLIFPTITKSGTVYAATFSVSNFSTFYIHPNRFPFAPLPVELTTFTGYNDGDKNILNWTTASEQNTNRFEIEKSLENSNWTYIGTKPAAGNSTQELHYDFVDNYPVLGNNYYRLKIVDNDGTFKYSNVINIPVKEAFSNTFAGIYPNPTSGVLNVEIQSTQAYSTSIEVTDVLGRKISSKTIQLNKGISTTVFDFNQLANGTYILQFIDFEGKTHVTKFVKD